MTRVDTIRSEIHHLVRTTPFRPFALNLENGDRALIVHPENIAFDPGAKESTKGWDELYVIANGVRVFSSFGAVTSVGLVDSGELSE
jgi:hypothetical protein